jgi:hypothetical protein
MPLQKTIEKQVVVTTGMILKNERLSIGPGGPAIELPRDYKESQNAELFSHDVIKKSLSQRERVG